MFCPIGPSTSIASSTTGSISLPANRNGALLRVQVNGNGKCNVAFTASGGVPIVDFDVFGSEAEIFGVPSAATTVVLTTSGSSSGAASAVLGQKV